MKATDLMIGDWVHVDGVQVDDDGKNPVYQFLAKRVEGLRKGVVEIDHYEFPPYLCMPIPLTPEILEKNGFSKPQDAGDGTLICGMTIVPYRLTFQSVFGLPILTIENVVDNDNNHTCLVLKDEIYNVHELQHALKLCGIEKEIII